MRTTGIYQIKNKENGKLYIGSSFNIEFRFNKHKSLLRKGTSKSSKLQEEWNLYGEKSFEFSVLEIFEKIEKDELLRKEDEYILAYSSNQEMYGYNTYSAVRVKGEYSHSQETRKKISEAQIGKKLTEEHKQNISRGLVGKITHSEETRKQIGLKNRRKTISEEMENSIRKDLIDGLKGRDIAEKYSLTTKTISFMKKELEQEGLIQSKEKLKDKAILLLKQNLSIKQIAEITKVTETTIRNYKKSYLEGDKKK